MSTIRAEYKRAVRLHRTGNLNGAKLLYQRVLARNPRHGAALHGLGELMGHSQQFEEAVRLFVKAIETDGPKHPHCASLGRLLMLRGLLGQAATCFRQAIAANPLDASVYRNLSRTLVQTGDLPGAALAAEQAVAIQPGCGDAWCGLGVVLWKQGHLERAEECFRRALSLSPNGAEAAYNLGVVLHAQGRTEEEEAVLKRAIAIRPDYAFAHNNLGNLLYRQGRPQKAVFHYRKALTSEPHFARAHLNLGLTLLSLGDYQQGFERYEWRRRTPETVLRPSKLPQWNGENLPEGVVLLHADQGLGDAIQFIRYAVMVKERVGTVVVECPRAIARLVSTAPGVDRVVPPGNFAEAADAEIPLASLPRIFATRVSSIPCRVPYFSVDSEALDKWRMETSRFRVGLVWAGNPRHSNDRNRTVPWELFQDITRLDGIRFFSLQKPPDIRPRGMVHLGAALDDLADTAAVLSQLDLVITADTAVAHLAGALGKPVWTLLPFAPDWRWMWTVEDTPWYPTMRLFRQTSAGDWQGVVDRVEMELKRIVGGGQAE